ncbi:MAG: SDR family NAD(P)-dependent oxidoreductase, partial [Rhodobacteraceae bacterium]|nr:SDR family NAD(P)-dependent oxidoreductase [Paracoccaceae bacterium]
LSCREAVRAMRRSEGQGRIVNVAARPALVPTAGMVSYTASKAAVASMTQSLGEELAAESIFVNAVVPSVMNTPANRAAMPDADHSLWPSVNDVAETMVFLLSPTNASTRGGLIPVYGKA